MPHTARRTSPVRANPAIIRILIVDDSAVARAALSRILADAPMFEVVAALDSARRAIDWLKETTVDVVLLDIQMPGLDGLAALPALIEASEGARILIVSTLAGDGARATIKALALGATETLAKPAMGALGRQFGDVLIEKIKRLGNAKPTAFAESPERHNLRTGTETPIACLAIGASTGGLHALAAFFANLPRTFDAPILVTQHLPTAFMLFFADQLSALSGRQAQVAKGGETLRNHAIFVAPGDRHIGVISMGPAVETILLDQPSASRCCPSVDPMFESVAALFGAGALGVVLSGMGRDGEIGARALAAGGGTVIVQDAPSSAVWGMPGAVARAGLASLITSPAGLAGYIGQRGSVR